MTSGNNFESFRFDGQHEGERVLFWCRENIVGFVLRATGRMAITLGLTGLYQATLLYYGEIEHGLLLDDMIALFVAGQVTVFFVSALWMWTLWTLTVFVITDHRLIKIVPPTPFTSFSTGVKLLRVQDVSYRYKTFIHSLLNFGDLTARSASGAEEPFYIRNISNPRDLNHYLHKLVALLEDAHIHRKARPKLPVFVVAPKGERYPVSELDAQRDPSLRPYVGNVDKSAPPKQAAND